MKKYLWIFPIAFVLLGFYTARLLDGRVESLLKTLQLSEDDAKQTIFSDISSPSFYLPGIRELKIIALKDRASQVEVIAKYVKEYTHSDDFKKRYNQYRELKKPTPPEKPKTMEEIKNEERLNLKNGIEEMKNARASLPDDQKAMFDENIKYMEEQLKAIDDPDNPMYSPDMDSYMQEGYQQQLEQHKTDIAEWEKTFPANNPDWMIKGWLEEFIDKTKDVDFNAETAIDENGGTVFIKKDYEGKNSLWKLCFRAGKETTESARKFSQNWLSELK